MIKKILIITSIIINAGAVILFGSISINRIQQNARIDSQEVINQTIKNTRNEIVNAIVAGIEQQGEVIIKMPDGNGGTRAMVLVMKEGSNGRTTATE